MTNINEDSKIALEQIENLLDKLNDDHVWDLIDFLRDKCQVIIPVWFTVPLVQEITEESLGLTLNKEQTEELIFTVNNNDSSYTVGRNLVEFMIKHNLPEDCLEENEQLDDTDDESDKDDGSEKDQN